MPASRVRFGAPLTVVAQSATPRPYAPDLTPQVSLLRPHCLAQDRLLLWKPIFTVVAVDSSGTHLPALDEHVARAPRIIADGYAESTRRTYGSAILVYNVWADANNLSDLARFPATNSVMIAFASACAGSYSGTTISGYISGIRAWHGVHSVGWAVNEDDIARIARGSKAHEPDSSRRRKRDPYTKELLALIRTQLDLAAPLDAAVWACITTAFYGVARLGELTVGKLETVFDPLLHVSRSGVRENVTGRDNEERRREVMNAVLIEFSYAEQLSAIGNRDPPTAYKGGASWRGYLLGAPVLAMRP